MNGDHLAVVQQAAAAGRLGPIAARMLLGSWLRALRGARGITREEAGKVIRASPSKIARMELGYHGFKERDVLELLGLYEVPEPDRATLFELSRQANEPGWWRPFHDVVPDWFENYLGLEQSAAVVRCYETRAVHDLLQTPDYARAELAGRFPEDSAETRDRRLELRLRRQEILTRQDGPRVWIVLDESVVRRPAGGAALMRAQFDHILELADRRNITVQVLPFARGIHAAGGPPLSLLRPTVFGVLPDVVFLELMDDGRYPSRPAEVERHRLRLDRIGMRAAPPEELAAVLHRVLSEG